MKRPAFWIGFALGFALTGWVIQTWECRTLRAELAQRTAAWEECNIELESYRD